MMKVQAIMDPLRSKYSAICFSDLWSVNFKDIVLKRARNRCQLCLYESTAKHMRWRAIFRSASSNKKFGILPSAIVFYIEFRIYQQAEYVKWFVQECLYNSFEIMIKKYSRSLHKYWTRSNGLKCCQGKFLMSKDSVMLKQIAGFPQCLQKQIRKDCTINGVHRRWRRWSATAFSQLYKQLKLAK